MGEVRLFIFFFYKIFDVDSIHMFTCVCVCVCSRVGIYVNSFQSLAGQQEKFHREMGKVSPPTD